MTRPEALIGLNTVYDIGSIRLNKLLRYFGEPQEILKAPLERLSAVSGIGKKTAASIRCVTEQEIDRELVLAKKAGVEILTQEDRGYPVWLKNIYDPPIVLYIKGRIEEIDIFSIAIVGSRRASYYGLSAAGRFAGDLAERGFTVVSGLARGIDTYAHRGALKRGGRSIAVIGSGFNNIYPRENKGLAEEIEHNGAVISEFPMEMLPLKQNFPRRNRVISGLSMGVLVAEAAKNSGALITADFALEQGREVFALPGKVDSETSFGTNGLIKQGAKLVSCVDDLLEEFVLPLERTKKKESLSLPQPAAATQEERRVYELICRESVQLEELVEKTNMDIPKISVILLRLQIKGMVKALAGKQFIRDN